MRPMIEQVRTKLSIAFDSAKYLTTGNVAHNKAAIETTVEAALRDLDKIKSEQQEIDIQQAVEWLKGVFLEQYLTTTYSGGYETHVFNDKFFSEFEQAMKGDTK